MQFLESFFGAFLLIGIIACGLAWMFSAQHGMGIAKRVGLSVLIFVIGTMLVPMPGTNLLIGAGQILVAFALMFVAIVGLVNAQAIASLLRILIVLGGAVLVLVTAIDELRSTPSGWTLLLAVAAGLAAIIRLRAVSND